MDLLIERNIEGTRFWVTGYTPRGCQWAKENLEGWDGTTAEMDGKYWDDVITMVLEEHLVLEMGDA